VKTFAFEAVDRSVRRMLVPPEPRYLTDETQTRALVGHADAVALPTSPEEVAQVAWPGATGTTSWRLRRQALSWGRRCSSDGQTEEVLR
jgi:hypothetical protein